MCLNFEVVLRLCKASYVLFEIFLLREFLKLKRKREIQQYASDMKLFYPGMNFIILTSFDIVCK